MTFDEILGLGYTGYAVMDGLPLLLNGSSVQEQEVFIKSAVGPSTTNQTATGEPAVRSRRILNLQLNFAGNRNALLLALRYHLSWRANPTTPYNFTLKLRTGDKEGYDTLETFMQSATISAPAEQLVTVSMNLVSYTWNDISQISPPNRISPTALNPLLPELAPIPYWMCTMNHPGMVGTPLEFSLALQNNWQFVTLAEATPGPPHPRVISYDRLTAELSCTSLAQRGARPGDNANDVVLTYGGGETAGTTFPTTTVTLPFLYRDPQRSPAGVGEQNSPLKWTTSWSVLGANPTFT
jgi:hypothetical protein